MTNEHTSIRDVANTVCGRLPHGWTIHIHLERESGWVDLFSPKWVMLGTGPKDSDETIAECVSRLVDKAIRIDAEQRTSSL